jgi:hypothetical protein
MTEPELHRHFLHYSELPFSMRVLYTAALLVLGLGYVFALIHLYHTYSGKDGNALTLSYRDLVIAYTGTGKGSRLESALSGSMSTMLPPDELATVVEWVQQRAERATYEKQIRPILDKRCMSCHDGSNPHLPSFTGYESLLKITERDTGTDIFTLVRVSHIHLFGFTFIFFIMGLIFGHAYVRPVWLKATVVALPFLFLAVDILSWYMVKVFHPFALLTMGSGALMGLCFAFMWFVSVYQMWFSSTPPAILERDNRAASPG